MHVTNWEEWMKKNHIRLKPVTEDKSKSEKDKTRPEHR